MAAYEWICRECNIWWDRECRVGKAPDRTKCPKCKALSHRYFQHSVPISFKDDGAGNQNNPGVQDFHTVRRRYQLRKPRKLQTMNLSVICRLILTGINSLTQEGLKKWESERLEIR